MSSEVWGHRGWPARYPDNVIEGIRAAGAVAARVEIDVRRTIDGVLALSHDPDLAGHVVSASRWSELEGLDLGSGYRPARLDHLLVAAPEVALNIEIKNSPFDPGFEEDLGIVDAVAELARIGDVISSFHWPTVDRMRQLRPELSTGLLFEASIPVDAAMQHAVAAGHEAVVPHHPLVDAALVAAAHQRDLQVVTWTVNDGGQARRLDALGVDAIITNDPGAIIAAVRQE